jgi:histidinol-phosphate aminotransferase
MDQKIDRRNLLKSGLMAIGGMTLAPHLSVGAFADQPITMDPENRIFRSPMVREHYLPNDLKAPKIAARLSSNENPYGPPVSAQKAVMDAVKSGNRYAGRDMFELIEKIAKKEGVTPDHLMVAPGSSDLLEKVAIVLFMKGGNIVSADPCYMSMIRVAESVGAKWKAIPCTSDWSHDLKAMEAAIDSDTKLVYVCNPNNPTGAITKGQDLLDFCSRVSEKVPVFVDEAYIELAVGADTQSMISLLSQKKNVIVARTFSKIMGMAGLRFGYMVALPSFLKEINKITRGGFSITNTTVAAAKASMEDNEFQNMTRKLNHEAKLYLYSNLDKMGYKYIPSYTNFVLFPVSIEGKALLSKMMDKGISIRSFDIQNKPWCRVSIGTMDEMKIFVGALQTISA